MQYPVPDPIPVPPPVLFLECVIVCDGYADFLAETLPHHRSVFDKLVVVTSFEDRATQRLCEFWHVECVKTDSTGSRKGEMCKGVAINDGLARLSKKGWVLHLDADILLPPRFREIIGLAELNSEHIYGCDRFMVRDHHAWRSFMEMPLLQQENGSWVHLGAFELGTRVCIPGYGGYVPIGFFQLWNPGISGISKYPDQHSTAARTDTEFALRWPRSKRSFLPEVVCYHLESEHAPMAKNWGGRKTLPFTHDSNPRQVIQPTAWAIRTKAQKDECNS